MTLGSELRVDIHPDTGAADAGFPEEGSEPVSRDSVVFGSQLHDLSATQEIVVQTDSPITELSGFAGQERCDRSRIQFLHTNQDIGIVAVPVDVDTHLSQKQQCPKIPQRLLDEV
jgi:hypothetical protein